MARPAQVTAASRPRLTTRSRVVSARLDLVTVVSEARDRGLETVIIDCARLDRASVAGLGRVLDIVSEAGGARVEDAGGRVLDRVSADDPLRAVGELWRRWGASVSSGDGGDYAVAIGGFAFRRDREPAEPWTGFPAVMLRVPRLTVVRRDGRTRIVAAALIDGHDEAAAMAELRHAEGLLRAELPVHRGPEAHRVQTAAVRDPVDWMAAVEIARSRLAAGSLVKVVLAREATAQADGVVNAGAVLRSLRAADPSCHTFLVPGADGTALVGATPELLVARHGAEVRCDPMAGSIRRGADDEEDSELATALLASAKDRREHAVVIEAVVAQLKALGADVSLRGGPEVARFASIQHLVTPMLAHFDGDPPSVLELGAALHPTPAVGGEPRDAALALIDQIEGFDRGWYSGAVGWIDAAGDGELVVALRCGLLWEDGARLYAGVGIMSDSDPETELAETELKFRSLLAALAG